MDRSSLRLLMEIGDERRSIDTASSDDANALGLTLDPPVTQAAADQKRAALRSLAADGLITMEEHGSAYDFWVALTGRGHAARSKALKMR